MSGRPAGGSQNGLGLGFRAGKVWLVNDWRADRIGAALAGNNPTVLAQLPDAFAVIGDVQWLPGYCVLLTDDTTVSRLSDLPTARRRAYLDSVDRLAAAVESACGAADPAFRRVNIEILGNTDPFLHTHVWPRYDWEPDNLRGRPVWLYPESRWRDSASALGAQHDALRAAITMELQRGVGDSGLTLPRLSRPPVVLRPFTAADTPAVREAALDPLIPLITTVPAVPDDTTLRAYLDRQNARATIGRGYSLAITDAYTNQAVGQIGLWPHDDGRASIGYWIVPSARRHGYASHALGALSQWGFDVLNVARLELYIAPDNEPSWRTAEHIGYQREGLMRSWQTLGGDRRDMYMYSLTAL